MERQLGRRISGEGWAGIRILVPRFPSPSPGPGLTDRRNPRNLGVNGGIISCLQCHPRTTLTLCVGHATLKGMSAEDLADLDDPLS